MYTLVLPRPGRGTWTVALALALALSSCQRSQFKGEDDAATGPGGPAALGGPDAPEPETVLPQEIETDADQAPQDESDNDADGADGGPGDVNENDADEEDEDDVVDGGGVPDNDDDHAEKMKKAEEERLLEVLRGLSSLRPSNRNLNLSNGTNSLTPATPNTFPGGDTPLALDRNKDGRIDSASGLARTPILFDVNADGRKTEVDWISPVDALLVFDRNGNGTIDDGRELFGNGTDLDGRKARDGFEALAALDENRDGRIDNGDKAYAALALWTDTNLDGLSQATELVSLTKSGVRELSVKAMPSSHAAGPLSAVLLVSTYVDDEGEHLLGDVFFFTKPVAAR